MTNKQLLEKLKEDMKKEVSQNILKQVITEKQK